MARGAEAKTGLTEYYAAKGALPTSGADTAFNTGPAGKVRAVKWVKVDDTHGRIEVEAVTTAASNGIVELNTNNVLAFGGSVTTSGVIEWACGQDTNTTIVAKYRPGSCK